MTGYWRCARVKELRDFIVAHPEVAALLSQK